MDNIDLIKEIFVLVEAYLNEFDEEKVRDTRDERIKRNNEATKALWGALRKPGENQQEVERTALAANLAQQKLDKNTELYRKRQRTNQKKLEAFRDKLLNSKPQTKKETDKAGEEQSSARINQGLRNKLENALKISESCLCDILALLEGDVEDFNKRKQAKEAAEEMNRMMQNGETDSIRLLPNGKAIGDASVMKKIEELRKKIHGEDNNNNKEDK